MLVGNIGMFGVFNVSSSSLSVGWGRDIGNDGGGVGIGVVIGDFR